VKEARSRSVSPNATGLLLEAVGLKGPEVTGKDFSAVLVHPSRRRVRKTECVPGASPARETVRSDPTTVPSTVHR
jgi:hypothetical protein